MQTEWILRWHCLQWVYIMQQVWWMPGQARCLFSITTVWCAGVCYRNLIVSNSRAVVMDTSEVFRLRAPGLSPWDPLHMRHHLSVAETVLMFRRPVKRASLSCGTWTGRATNIKLETFKDENYISSMSTKATLTTIGKWTSCYSGVHQSFGKSICSTH